MEESTNILLLKEILGLGFSDMHATRELSGFSVEKGT